MNQLDELKALQKGFDIEGRSYELGKMPFKVGRKILAYMTVVAGEIEEGKLGFIDTDKFERDIEPLLIKYTNVDGFKLETLEGHFDEYPSDYFQFVVKSLQGYAAPFLQGTNTSSASTSQKPQTTTLRKPM